ncbi:MAG TPA: hypothetical protein VFN68_16655 [Acidimicrobiales bacterium]|nr:hypothetical protein [Acidimicrobiales bacterium]
MGEVVSVERERTSRLADAIERELRVTGARELRIPMEAVEDPGRWRRAGVLASHRLGFKASTFAVAGVLGLIVHQPVTDAERRRFANAMAALIVPRGAARF